MQKQDVILSVNENHVDSPRDVARMVGGIEAGKVVRLTILRNGKTLQLSFPLGPKPASGERSRRIIAIPLDSRPLREYITITQERVKTRSPTALHCGYSRLLESKVFVFRATFLAVILIF
jgi:hypothetical protein